mmetsp:Transcript_7167/g.15837  ORF Transcript_7167/g.15837 Transcript_7167/m.15837 type:complete len:297 (+) Transcript_7167:48-938(+)
MWDCGRFATLFYATGYVVGMFVVVPSFYPSPPLLHSLWVGRALLADMTASLVPNAFYCINDSQCVVEYDTTEEGERAFSLSARQNALLRIREIDFSKGRLGSTVWPSSLALGQWLVDSSEAASAELVLELGCGVGLVSVAAALSGAKHVFATDLQAESEAGEGPDGLIENVRHNAHINGVAARVTARPLDWHLESSYLAPCSCDLVVGSDLVYYPENVEPLVHALKHHLAPGGTALLIGPRRAHAAGARSASICDVAALLPTEQVRLANWTLRQTRTEVLELQLLRWSRPSLEDAV